MTIKTWKKARQEYVLMGGDFYEFDKFPTMQAEIDGLREALAAQRERTCEWRLEADENAEIYYSTCGAAWSFVEGDRKENDVHFCQLCGGKIVELIRESGE